MDRLIVMEGVIEPVMVIDWMVLVLGGQDSCQLFLVWQWWYSAGGFWLEVHPHLLHHLAPQETPWDSWNPEGPDLRRYVQEVMSPAPYSPESAAPGLLVELLLLLSSS